MGAEESGAFCIAVTGSTGNVGRSLVRQLLRKGARVRAIARNSEKLAPLPGRGAEPCAADLRDTARMSEAFRGVDAVFAMIPEHPNIVDFLLNERRTAAFLMENHLASIQLIRNVGINGSPARGDIPFALVSTHDIGTVAVGLLEAPAFEGYALRELLGPRDCTYREATSILGSAIGKPDLPSVEFSFSDFRDGLVGAGFSPTFVDDLIELYAAVNEELMQNMVRSNGTNTTPATLGQSARDIVAPAFQMS